jgi:hypothetical protein
MKFFSIIIFAFFAPLGAAQEGRTSFRYGDTAPAPRQVKVSLSLFKAAILFGLKMAWRHVSVMLASR